MGMHNKPHNANANNTDAPPYPIHWDVNINQGPTIEEVPIMKSFFPPTLPVKFPPSDMQSSLWILRRVTTKDDTNNPLKLYNENYEHVQFTR